MKLATTFKEREEYDNKAYLYAILQSLELLERAFFRDSITQEEYSSACAKFISQYKSVSRVLEKSVPDVSLFAQEYKLDCPAALARLEIGIPSTIENPNPVGSEAINAKVVAEVVQNYITVMDSIKLSMVAVDNLHPLLGELMQSLGNLNILPPTFQGKAKIREWLILLNKLKASDDLDEDQIRQLSFDLEQSYNDFIRLLG
ncbi:Vacuolar protein sorting-associated protein 28-like protein [Smittium mucronatum]|uniref:Vacuolar protein sorting-associated protein 28 n=1 Tax=Smittium mucronatum TaxID=133383 RepID=A0A1R0GZ17_9FUNG|nr:Vacuolar protein sorting-associated protein 28-like protein [Smittium mucronatum]